ncbi:hypothetical protein ACKI2B_46735, partial [Streptomyces scabiei]
DAVEPAVTAGLLDVGTLVRFRHPLLRSAIYRSAGLAELREVHRVLAAATVSALVLVPLVLWSVLGSDDDEGQTAGTSPSDTA